LTSSEYDAFGLQSGGNGSSNSIGYTGQRLDNETGLMALGNGERYYSPNYARFIQQDSFSGVLDMPQSLNRFAYAHNNPNKHTDPSGNVIPLIVYGLALIAVATVSTSTVESHARHNLEGEEKGWAADDPRRSWGAALGDGSGMTKIVNAVVGQDVYTGRDLSTSERVWQGTMGVIEVIGNATAVGGLIFKAGSLVINTARGGSELLNITRGAYNSIKNVAPALKDAKAVVDAIRTPFQTAKAGWEAVKGAGQATWQAGKELFKDGVGQAAKRTVKNAWEFTKERLNPFNYKRDGANINFVGNGKETARAVNSAGRQSADNILNDEEIAFVKKEFEEIGGNTEMLRFNHGDYTGYVDRIDKINIKGDVFPNLLSNHPNSAMSVRATLAHELGHQNFRGTSLAQGSWNDEFRASYWASKNIPNLSAEDKYMLVSDAVQRAREAKPIVAIKLNRYIKETLYGGSE
jgi:RHS repeat-associated protein